MALSMFQNVRQGGMLYILHKGRTLKLDIASITSVSAPIPRYPSAPTFSQGQEMIVDITAKIGDQEFKYEKLPAASEIADFGSDMVISISRDAIANEVAMIKQKADDIIASREYNEDLSNSCSPILASLNPEYKQAAELDRMQGQIDSLAQSVAQLVAVIKGQNEAISNP